MIIYTYHYLRIKVLKEHFVLLSVIFFYIKYLLFLTEIWQNIDA